MHLDPILPIFVAITLMTLVLSIILKRFNQPYVIAYLLAGGVLGPYGLEIISNDNTIIQLGSMGVVILMFFIGMEVSPTRLTENWKITVLGTLFQITMSVCIVALLGFFLDWPINRIILLGFVISISSTVVVIQLLRDWQELDTRIGQDVLGVLLVQDIALVPMIIILGLLDNQKFQAQELMLQLVGGVLIISSVVCVSKKEQITWKWTRYFADDSDLQVFAALSVCTGFAFITGLMHLSTALGAFVAGVFVSRFADTHWIGHSLESLRVLFVALFFLSIGILVDIEFFVENLHKIITLTIVVLTANTLIVAFIVRLFGYDWRSSLYAGSLLSQVGEFSFILAAIGLNTRIIAKYSYQMTISIIVITMIASPVLIFCVRRYVFAPKGE